MGVEELGGGNMRDWVGQVGNRMEAGAKDNNERDVLIRRPFGG